MNKLFVVVRINGSETYAHEDSHWSSNHDDAIRYCVEEMAQPDPGDRIEYGWVRSPDAGMARLAMPHQWYRYGTAV